MTNCSTVRQPTATGFPETTLFRFHIALAIVGIVAGLGVARVPALRHLWFPAILGLYAAVGFWIMSATPPSHIDVYMFQRDAATALINGRNPYEVRFPNIYGPDTPFYNPRLIQNGWLTFSFPFLWEPKAFVDSVVTLQLYQPFRGDSLSFPAFIAARGGPIQPGGLAFATAGTALALGLWLAAPTPAGSAAIVALVYYVFFATNKQAFANYHLFVIGAMCCAIAAARLDLASAIEQREGPAT